MQAASMGETFRLKNLLEKGEKVDSQDSQGFTALHSAISGGWKDCVELLVNKGKANVNLKDKEGTTPLHLAATMQDDEMVACLLKAGASVNAEDKMGTPLHRCAVGNDSQGHDGISSGIKAGNSAKVAKLLLEAGAKVNAANRTGRTPLHLAAQKNDAQLAQALLAHGANKTAKDTLGMTPYNFAEGKNQIKQLLDNPSPMPVPFSSQHSTTKTAPSPSTSTSTSSSSPSSSTASSSASPMFCGQCGTKATFANAVFCAGCGQKMH